MMKKMTRMTTRTNSKKVRMILKKIKASWKMVNSMIP